MWQARALLAVPPRPGSAEADANAALQAAGASCDAATDPLFASVRLTYATDSAAADALVRPARSLVLMSCCTMPYIPGMQRPAAILCYHLARSTNHSYVLIDEGSALLRAHVLAFQDSTAQLI